MPDWRAPRAAVVADVQDVGDFHPHDAAAALKMRGSGLAWLFAHGRNPLRAIFGRCHGSAHFVEYSAF